MLKRNHEGFTLIELLIVVAIIGIIAAIAIPNLLNAIQRGKQKRTMGDIRTVGTAVESYSIDNNRYPDGTPDVAAITSYLEPTYIKKSPETDGWANAIEYAVTAALNEYTLTSRGKDGTASGPASGPTTDFDHDIIFSTGSFVTWPEGTQTSGGP
jgi:general secretion pathway protein G